MSVKICTADDLVITFRIGEKNEGNDPRKTVF
jgi:hypothetical protein